MMRLLAAICALFVSLSAMAQVDSLNMTKLGHRSYQTTLSDVWGWADTANAREYALVGLQDGFSLVDVTNPTSPQQEFYIPGAYSLWKDLKSFGHYGYMCHDYQFSWSTGPDDGILIVNLDSLQNPTYKKFKPKVDGGNDSLLTAHNIFIDENGILYVFGAAGFGGNYIGNGGALMYDLKPDPMNPTYVGTFGNFYLHDGYVRNDTLYGGAINIGQLAVIDVRSKSNPVVLATKTTPNAFAHNTWLSDDGNTVFTTDEKPNAYITAYDVSDVNNITELDRIRTLPGTDIIPHNVHVIGDYLVSSYYTSGCHVVDAKYPDLLVEVGYYDTSPSFSGTGYHGAWGAYPFLPSGNILISDMEEGLYILSFEKTEAARVYGYVIDSLTGLAIPNANVDFSKLNFSQVTKLDGEFKAGTKDAGFETILASAPGYFPNIKNYTFANGSTDTVLIKLLPKDFNTHEEVLNTFKVFPNPSADYFYVSFPTNVAGEEMNVSIYSANGSQVWFQKVVAKEKIRIQHNLPHGIYTMHVQLGDTRKTIKIVVQ